MLRRSGAEVVDDGSAGRALLAQAFESSLTVFSRFPAIGRSLAARAAVCRLASLAARQRLPWRLAVGLFRAADRVGAVALRRRLASSRRLPPALPPRELARIGGGSWPGSRLRLEQPALVVVQVAVEGLHAPSATARTRRTPRGNARSWLTSITVPSNSLSAIVSASRVVRSRWLVGSSSSSRLGRCHDAWPAPGAPSRRRTCCPRLRDHVAGEAEGAEEVAQLLFAPLRAGVARQAHQVHQRAVAGEQIELLLREVADGQALPSVIVPADGAHQLVRHHRLHEASTCPWPLAPRMPMRWPASTERSMPRTMVVSRPSSAPYPAQAISASIGFGSDGGSRNSNWKSLAVSTGAELSMRASALTRALRLLGLAGLALKRSMNFCRWAMRSCWRS